MMDTREFQALLARLDRINGPVGPTNGTGSLSHLTAEAVRRAAQAVRSGQVISCADRAAGRHVHGDRDKSRPQGLVTSVESAADWAAVNDRVTVDLHGPAAQTHLDALGHFYYQGRGYGGSSREHITETGVLANDVTPAAAGIVGRGLLLDLPRVLDLPYVPADHPVSITKVTDWLDTVGAQPQPGDLLFIRTGRPNSPQVSAGEFHNVASLDLDCAEWIARSRFSLVISDCGMDSPVAVVDEVPTPWHIVLLVALGTWLVDSADLEELADACTREGRHDFLATLGPMPLAGATASPVNPIVVL